MTLPFHPLADAFPLMEGAEFGELVDDIRQYGLREPIVILDGMVLDGRNRQRACEASQVDARYEPFPGGDPVAFVVSANLRRRHLDESQRAMVAAKLANIRLGDNQHSTQAGSPIGEATSQERAAKLLNVSKRSVERAAVVRDHGVPELAQKVERGAVAVSTAADVAAGYTEPEQHEIVARGETEILEAAKRIRSERTAQKAAENAALKATTPVLVPTGKYQTIVIDPPWDMQKIEREVRPNQVAFDYPTMTEDELAAYPVPDLACDDCHLFCWTTQRFLPTALRLIEGWGFRYIVEMVWHKPGGFQPVGLPQYNCEFVIYGRKGAPEFVDTKAFPCCFYAERREHSRKPDEFYDLIRRVTSGPRTDVFSREPRAGFDQYGNQTDKFRNDGDPAGAAAGGK